MTKFNFDTNGTPYFSVILLTIMPCWVIITNCVCCFFGESESFTPRKYFHFTWLSIATARLKKKFMCNNNICYAAERILWYIISRGSFMHITYQCDSGNLSWVKLTLLFCSDYHIYISITESILNCIILATSHVVVLCYWIRWHVLL